MKAFEIRYHNAMPNWAKLLGLKIKAIHECEGGGFAIDKEQAERIHACMTACEGMSVEDLEKWRTLCQ